MNPEINIVKLTDIQVKNIILFLDRTSLKGYEAVPFLELKNAITYAEKEKSYKEKIISEYRKTESKKSDKGEEQKADELIDTEVV